MAKGFGIRAMAEGFLSGSNGNGHSSNGSNGSHGGSQPGNNVDALLGNLGKLVGPALEKLTGQGSPTTEQADAIVRALAASPQALQAIADALAGETKPVEVKTVEVKPAVSPVPAGNSAAPAVVVASAGDKKR